MVTNYLVSSNILIIEARYRSGTSYNVSPIDYVQLYKRSPSHTKNVAVSSLRDKKGAGYTDLSHPQSLQSISALSPVT